MDIFTMVISVNSIGNMLELNYPQLIPFTLPKNDPLCYHFREPVLKPIGWLHSFEFWLKVY